MKKTFMSFLILTDKLDFFSRQQLEVSLLSKFDKKQKYIQTKHYRISNQTHYKWRN